MSQGVPLVRRW